VLVIDDDEAVRERVRLRLAVEGFVVDEAADGERGLELAQQHPPHLVVLDLVLPGLSGLEVLQRLREVSNVPVVLLSALSEEGDRVSGLELGADDYVVKPFSARELLARIRSVLRRADGAGHDDPAALVFGPLVVDLAHREVLLEDDPVALTRREFDLLAFLVAAPRQTFSRAQLLEQVWTSSAEWQNEATVTEHIHRLRQHLRLGEDGAGPCIRTMRGVGYSFEPNPRRGAHGCAEPPNHPD
jgi:DNA-binding response OmpR family regulator